MPGHPQNGINERALEDASSERGSEDPLRVRAGPSGEGGDFAERGAAAGCQVRVCTQRPRWEEKKGRGEKKEA